MKSKGTINLAVKPDRGTHKTCLCLREYLIGGFDVDYFIIYFKLNSIVLYFILFYLF
jgi:hypothetical protein